MKIKIKNVGKACVHLPVTDVIFVRSGDDNFVLGYEKVAGSNDVICPLCGQDHLRDECSLKAPITLNEEGAANMIMDVFNSAEYSDEQDPVFLSLQPLEEGSDCIITKRFHA